jgi:osmotically-inducible protein OsmY
MKNLIRLVTVMIVVSPFLQACIPLIVGAGVGAGVMMAEDRRTNSTILEDQTIEVKAKNRFEEKYKDTIHASVTSFNRYVLITGQAPTEEIRQDLTTIVLEVEGVRNVQNEAIVAGNASFTSRSSDTLTTSSVKGRLAQNKEVGANNVKVLTENSTVFLMGLVTRKEAEAAAQTAATTSGVQRVVKVFEYTD